VLQTATTHGRAAALTNIAGNPIGVLTLGTAIRGRGLGLIAGDQAAYDGLRLAGAAYLIYLGLRALFTRRAGDTPTNGAATAASPGSRRQVRPARVAAPKGLINSLADPKLAVFFVALFPQFLNPGAAVLPAAPALAGGIVAFDLVWYGTVAVLVDRFHRALRPRMDARVAAGQPCGAARLRHTPGRPTPLTTPDCASARGSAATRRFSGGGPSRGHCGCGHDTDDCASARAVAGHRRF
jgi:threonine/homoserine/homoserine lactone efflux protein